MYAIRAKIHKKDIAKKKIQLDEPSAGTGDKQRCGSSGIFRIHHRARFNQHSAQLHGVLLAAFIQTQHNKIKK